MPHILLVNGMTNLLAILHFLHRILLALLLGDVVVGGLCADLEQALRGAEHLVRATQRPAEDILGARVAKASCRRHS